ncbi:polymorphic outer membrane protein, putative [Trichomonas vaginalis G3]|uniref:Polymorphic outer membrane protein, putative n=1 Tax=Trichomonas vaginalis (strain ATCC PRA-98 / G3) TaxID=412133 RepID=A2DTC1_TRIV3|nr:bifunctional inhibitor/lipid-transfer protein/seed storage 2s albumin superfamily protein family [Trichomonas vaginalis G3]EAY16393.1 polymorphic outer membrane protein, putative [Trichomonas vaginalis G3]KAI5488379.1 bifunctional inhibitor/lipid-transfer protein/seed storage 2s albumin superfamily protein family [Trichomonas vaginalis G3]|eukprot:XP_001328616.1 polymorphic outer membrane protein [Trichomonas vaginalis G3]
MDESTSDIYQYYEQATTIEDKEISSTGRTNTFYKCELTIKGRTKFSNNFAFGAGVTSSSGGAIFLCESIFQAHSDSPDYHIIFESNQAALGGAICAKASALLLYNTTFTSNMAYKHGGAIYFQSTFKPTESSYLSPQMTLIAGWLEFRQNIASEVGGAIAISYAVEVYIELSKFYSNKCSFTGGAISTANCDSLKLHRNWFAYNTVNASTTEYRLTTDTKTKLRGETIGDDYANTVIPNHQYGRGGGAIYFFSDSRKGSLPKGPKTYEQRIIQSYHCCFYKDSATTTGSSLGGGAGNEVLLDGYIEYVTYDDYMYGAVPEVERDEAISKVNRPLNGNCSVNYLQMRNTTLEPWGICEVITTDLPGIGDAPNIYNETNISYINATETENGTAYDIPNPTNFVYYATPITKFNTPITQRQYRSAATVIGASLKSGKIFPGSYSVPLLYPNFTITIPKPTPHETVATTPHNTPKYTPSPSDLIIIVTVGPTLNPNIPEVQANTDTTHNKKTKLLGLILGIVGGLLALIALSIFLFLYFREKDESTEDSALSLQEETVLTAKDLSSADVTITYTNPLWTTGITETDDPFVDDFQEQEKIENFFEQKDLR